MTFRLGLTGSIGMGKSSTAQIFADLGCAVWDADAAVHRLYSVGGAAIDPMSIIAPTSIIDGAISRDQLRELISTNPDLLKQIEGVVHPLVAADRAAFLKSTTADITVFDIPLLFETGGNITMDAVVCVSISPEIQKSRVLDRGSMTLEQFEQIRAKQMPNADKVAQSDYVVITDTPAHARDQVAQILAHIRKGLNNA